MPERSKDSGTLRVMVQGWIRPAAVLSVIFTLCYFSILQADFLYRDDLRRAAEGSRGWGFGRYLSLAFSLVLHTDTYLADISPLPQLLAVVLTALACVILHRILKGNDDFSHPGRSGVTASISRGGVPARFFWWFFPCS